LDAQPPSELAALTRVQLARLISAVERGDKLVTRTAASVHGKARVIGVTGVPGAGKSTLVDGLVALYRQSSNRVAVIAVDPTSPVTGGAVLGDRIRMNRHSTDEGVFIRSMGSRGRKDGLGPAVQDSCRILAGAGYDPILIETVGVGQVELGVVECCDIRVLVLAPAWGDYVQAAKAGLIEMVDVAVVNKSDLPGATALAQELKEAVRHRDGPRAVRVVSATASHAEAGVRDVRLAIEDAWNGLAHAGIRQRRVEAVVAELVSRVSASFAIGPLKSVSDDGTAVRLAEAVYDGRASVQEAADKLLRETLDRGLRRG
jgi:LAO/AO transport system kinase